MDPDSHESGDPLNISTGQIAQPAVNVDCSVKIGRKQLKPFETWPEGFYCKFSKDVVTFASQKKHVLVGPGSHTC